MNRRNLHTPPAQVVSLRTVLRVCAHATIVLILTMLSVGRAAAQDGWAAKAPDPGFKSGAFSGEINGLIYVYGFDRDAVGNQSSFVPRLSIFDPALNSWTTGAPPNLIRAGASGGIINGRMYVVGGCIMSDCRIGTTNALEIYDPLTSTWSNGAPMVTARLGAAAGVIAGKLYIAGGTLACPPCNTTDTTEIYDPTTNSWTPGAPIPTSRQGAAAAVVDGLFYVIGGYQGSINAEVGTVHVYDPVASSWSTRAPMPVPRVAASVGVINGHIYVVGGFGNGILAVNESYDPGSDSWTERTPMPTARYYATGSVVNSKLYVIGGNNLIQLFGTNEEYSPTPPSAPTLLSITVSPTTASVEVGKIRSFFATGHFTSGPDQPLSTVSWQSLDPAIASIGSSNSALGVAPGQTTIVATALVNGSTVSCVTTNTCGALTVIAPTLLTLTLAPGSVSFPSVQVAVSSNGEGEETYTLPFNQPIDAGAGSHRLVFAAPAGYTVTPTQVELQLQDGDSVSVVLFFAPIDTTPPVLTVSGNLIAEATDASGAIVTFLPPSATDSSGVQSVSCDRSSGENFGIGVTTVQCSATDNAGNVANRAFTVTVRDTTAPALTLPSNFVTDATSPVGATIVFTVSATDIVDGTRPVDCAPGSGAVFVIGLTTVNCASADGRGNTRIGSFTVTVRSAAQIVTDLAAQAASAAFSKLLQNVLTSISTGDIGTACGQLGAFINQVQAQTGKKLTVAQAAALITAADSAKAALGCQ